MNLLQNCAARKSFLSEITFFVFKNLYQNQDVDVECCNMCENCIKNQLNVE